MSFEKPEGIVILPPFYYDKEMRDKWIQGLKRKLGGIKLLVSQKPVSRKLVARAEWKEDFNTSEYEGGGGRYSFRKIRPSVADERAEALTKKFHKENPGYINEKARYIVGAPKDEEKDFGIYFVDIASDDLPKFETVYEISWLVSWKPHENESSEAIEKWKRGLPLDIESALKAGAIDLRGCNLRGVRTGVLLE